MAFYRRLKTNKYGNRKTGGYDSRAEARRGAELDLLQAAGEICNLKRQVKYVLIPAQYEKSDQVYTRGPHKGEAKPGKLIERECAYLADFVYTNRDGCTVVEDVKGMRTPEYIVKRKLMLFVHGIHVVEIGGKK